MASVRKSPTKKGTPRWQSVWAEPGPSGKPQRRTKNHASQKEARAHAQRMEQEVERKGIGDPQKHSVERYLKRWLAGLRERNELSPTTLSAYTRHAETASRHIGHIPLEKLSPADLDGLYTMLLQRGGRAGGRSKAPRGSRPLHPGTVRHIHRVLHVALEQARRWKMIPENPAKDATCPTQRRGTPKAFTTGEVAQLLDAAGARENYVTLATLLITGARRSELLGLALDAVDLDAGTLTIKRVVLEVEHAPVLREVTKSDSSARTIDIPPPLVELLREQKARVLQAALIWGKGYRREPMFLFARPDGEPLSPSGLTADCDGWWPAPASAGRDLVGGVRHRREDGADPPRSTQRRTSR